MKLVVVESPAKAKTIEKYLGKGYKVKASKGHVVDLPKSEIGVDFDHSYQPTYVVTKPAALKSLKQAYKDAKELIIATDMDREGEAIGWHIASQLGATSKGKVGRITFSEITKEAVQKALNNPKTINMDLVNAQEARRILDRIVGYKLSPLIWKKIRYGLSAGRVQSVALRLIVDREIEREAFKAEEYWSVVALCSQKSHNKIEVIHTKSDEEKVDLEAKGGIRFELSKHKGKKFKISNEKQAKSITTKIKGAKWIVTDVRVDESKRHPKAPFITSTLQRVAANWFSYSAKRTMQIAQKLYEAGHITYMRTDSTSLSASAIKSARGVIKSKFGEKYLPEKAKQYGKKTKNAQEAHEAIRPTNFSKTATDLGLDKDQSRLYELIRQRALASQMASALISTYKIEVGIEDYLFVSSTQQIKFDGYLKVYPEKVSDEEIVEMEVGTELFPTLIQARQHFTQPPGRYTEASLIKKLEAEGIGRPSTYASIISTIQTRKYVEKEGSALVPTDTGRVVNKLLVNHFADIVDLGFTSEMETRLDSIAEGQLPWEKMIDDFYKPFAKNLEEQDEHIKKADFVVLGDSPRNMKCPDCSKPMLIKLGRYGRFHTCSNFPECKGMRSIDGESEADLINKPNTKVFKETYEPAPKTEDDRDFLLKRGRYGEFWAHPDYPKVKDARPLVMLPEKMEEVYGEVPKTDDGRPYLIKKGRFGEFWAHPDYPKVKDIVKMKKKKDE